MRPWGPWGIERPVGLKDGAHGMFSSCIVDKMIVRGHGQILGPVEDMVSVLDITLVEGEGDDEQDLPETMTGFLQ
jgi:hypothetical protein